MKGDNMKKKDKIMLLMYGIFLIILLIIASKTI